MRSLVVYSLLYFIKVISRIFYRPDMQWVGDIPPDPWHDTRLVVFLNHTSLFEPVFVAGVPAHFIWRLARHGVIPAAEKTTGRPLVGMLFSFIAHHVVAITRERDHTWYTLLRKIDPDSMVVILPEGRMMRQDGLDASGQPMTVRGGVSDIIEAIGEGRMLIAYSGGLHHVQIPGHRPRIFKTVRMRMEIVEIASYRKRLLAAYGPERFKSAVKEDLERRRDFYCPVGDGSVSGKWKKPESIEPERRVAGMSR